MGGRSSRRQQNLFSEGKLDEAKEKREGQEQMQGVHERKPHNVNPTIKVKSKAQQRRISHR